MRAVIQRVTSGKVDVDSKTVGSVGKGYVILLGVGPDDNDEDVSYISDKIASLRLFEDDNGKVNLSVKEIGGEILLIPQFTLYGDCRKGRRPSFSSAAPPELADRLYMKLAEKLRQDHNINVETGVFGDFMKVSIENNGPVTILLDSEKNF